MTRNWVAPGGLRCRLTYWCLRAPLGSSRPRFAVPGPLRAQGHLVGRPHTRKIDLPLAPAPSGLIPATPRLWGAAGATWLYLHAVSPTAA